MSKLQKKLRSTAMKKAMKASPMKAKAMKAMKASVKGCVRFGV